MKKTILSLILASNCMLFSQTGLLINSGTTGQSGLKFANITSTTTPTANPGKVLSLNSSGDVILVTATTGTSTFAGAQNGCSSSSLNIVELGNDLNSTSLTAQLIGSRRVHQNHKRLVFTGDSAGDVFHIGSDWTGSTPSNAPDARFYVENHITRGTSGIAKGMFVESNVGSVVHNVGLYTKVYDNNTTPATLNHGIFVDVSGSGTPRGITTTVTATGSSLSQMANGLKVDLSNLSSNSGTFEAIAGSMFNFNSSDPTSRATGIHLSAGSGTMNIGGLFECVPNSAGGGSGIPSPSVSIGTNGYCRDKAKEQYGGWFIADGVLDQTSNQKFAVGARGQANGSKLNIGIDAFADNGTGFTSASNNYGVYATAQGKYGANNYGVYAIAGNNEITTHITNTNVGVMAVAQTQYTANANIALWASILPSGSNWNSASKHLAGWLEGDVVINGTHGQGKWPFTNTWSPNTALEIDGDLSVLGKGFVNSGLWSGSDKKFKTNIKKLENTLQKLENINGYTYDFLFNDFKEMGFSHENQIGLIAQELKPLFPQLVTEDKNGFLAVNYSGFIPVLLQAIKEQQGQFIIQQNKIDLQNEMINNLQKQIDELKNGNNFSTTNGQQRSASTNITTNLNNNSIIVLKQNVPNPFAESTTIEYNIPNTFGTASIYFTDEKGQIIKSIEIKQNGKGSILVYGNDLTNGTYTYTLRVDDKIIDSHKLIKQ